MDDKVLVKWYDAKFHPGTHNRETILTFQMALFESLGYLISQDATTTKIAGELNNEGDYRDITLIPSGSIVSVTGLTNEV
jgi:hypothetical protein